MNMKKKYPKLFKSVKEVLGARRAVQAIKQLDRNSVDVSDSPDIGGAFVWHASPQGHNYWSRISSASTYHFY